MRDKHFSVRINSTFFNEITVNADIVDPEAQIASVPHK